MAITKVTGHVIDPITNITSHNINSSGIITATRFDGPIGAGLTDGNFSGIITSTQLNVTGVGTFNGIGVTSLNVSGVSTFSGNVQLLSTDAGSSAAPEFKLFRNSASPADADYIGQIKFAGESDTGVERNYAKITGKILDASNGTEDGILEFAHIKAGSQTITGRWRSDSLQLLNGTSLTVAGTADVTGNMTVGGNLNVTGVLTYDDVTNIDSIGIVTARTGIKVLAGGINAVGVVTATSFAGDVHASSLTVSGISTFSEVVKFDANVSSTPSASGNVHIYRHDNKLKVCGGSGIQFEEGGFTRWHITNGALHPHGTTYNNLGNTSNLIGHAYFGDSKKIHLGNDQDFTLQHNNAHAIVKNTTGRLYVLSDDVWFKNEADNKTSARFFEGNEVFLYHNDTVRLTTTSTGVTVGGEVAATQDYPNQRPALDFNFAAVKKLDPRITYYRTGPASYVNEFGKVVLVGDNTPRFDHDPVTRESKGLLIEQSRKNYLENGDFVSSYGSGNFWTYGHGDDVFTASSGSQLSTNPDGTSPAYHYEPSSTAAHHRFYRTFTLDAYDTSYVVSVFAKRVTEGSASNLNRYLEIEISGNFANNGAPTGHSGSHGMSSVTFDLQGDGAIQSQSTTYSGYVGSPKMEKYPDGWWRLSYVFNPGTNDGSSTLTGHIWLGHPTSLGNDAGNETGNGNPSFYLWGAMIEKSDFLTSYVPNHGAFQNTRGNEYAVIDGEDFTDFYNPVESSVLAVGTMHRPVAAQGQLNILHIGDDNEDGHGIFREHGTKDVWYHIRNGNSTPSGGNLNPNGFGDWDEGEEARIAIAFKDGDQAISVNGGNQITATVTSNYPTSNITKMWIGSHGTGSFFAGTIKRIAYYPKQLSDSQLNTLTA